LIGPIHLAAAAATGHARLPKRSFSLDMGSMMSFSKLSNGARMMLAAAAMLTVSSHVALADPTTLVCDESGKRLHYDLDGPITAVLEEGQSAVVINFPT
jgi:hypothetical protein